jgi:hypothetical protein
LSFAQITQAVATAGAVEKAFSPKAKRSAKRLAAREAFRLKGVEEPFWRATGTPENLFLHLFIQSILFILSTKFFRAFSFKEGILHIGRRV